MLPRNLSGLLDSWALDDNAITSPTDNNDKILLELDTMYQNIQMESGVYYEF